MIDNNKTKFLIDSIFEDMAKYLVEDKGISEIEALDAIYNSQYFGNLILNYFICGINVIWSTFVY